VQILRGLGERAAGGGCGKSEAQINPLVIIQESNRKSRETLTDGSVSDSSCRLIRISPWRRWSFTRQ
jgi:hypothetical protein